MESAVRLGTAGPSAVSGDTANRPETGYGIAGSRPLGDTANRPETGYGIEGSRPLGDTANRPETGYGIAGSRETRREKSGTR